MNFGAIDQAVNSCGRDPYPPKATPLWMAVQTQYDKNVTLILLARGAKLPSELNIDGTANCMFKEAQQVLTEFFHKATMLVFGHTDQGSLFLVCLKKSAVSFK